MVDNYTIVGGPFPYTWYTVCGYGGDGKPSGDGKPVVVLQTESLDEVGACLAHKNPVRIKPVKLCGLEIKTLASFGFEIVN